MSCGLRDASLCASVAYLSSASRPVHPVLQSCARRRWRMGRKYVDLKTTGGHGWQKVRQYSSHGSRLKHL